MKTAVHGAVFPVYGQAGNVLSYKTNYGIVELQLLGVETIIAPPPAPAKRAAAVPAETSGKGEKQIGQANVQSEPARLKKVLAFAARLAFNSHSKTRGGTNRREVADDDVVSDASGCAAVWRR